VIFFLRKSLKIDDRSLLLLTISSKFKKFSKSWWQRRNLAHEYFINFKIINKILINGWIRDFSMQYSDKKRGNIFKITSAKEYLSKIEEIILSQFINYIDNIETGISEKLNNSDKSYIKKQVKANIARNLWSSEDYYRIIIEDDEYVNKAIYNN